MATGNYKRDAGWRSYVEAKIRNFILYYKRVLLGRGGRVFLTTVKSKLSWNYRPKNLCIKPNKTHTSASRVWEQKERKFQFKSSWSEIPFSQTVNGIENKCNKSHAIFYIWKHFLIGSRNPDYNIDNNAHWMFSCL